MNHRLPAYQASALTKLSYSPRSSRNGGESRSRTYIFACEPVLMVPVKEPSTEAGNFFKIRSLVPSQLGYFPRGASLSWLSRTFLSRREDFRTALPRGACFTTALELRTGIEPALHWMKTRVPTPFRRPQHRYLSFQAVNGRGAGSRTLIVRRKRSVHSPVMLLPQKRQWATTEADLNRCLPGNAGCSPLAELQTSPTAYPQPRNGESFQYA